MCVYVQHMPVLPMHIHSSCINKHALQPLQECATHRAQESMYVTTHACNGCVLMPTHDASSTWQRIYELGTMSLAFMHAMVWGICRIGCKHHHNVCVHTHQKTLSKNGWQYQPEHKVISTWMYTMNTCTCAPSKSPHGVPSNIHAHAPTPTPCTHVKL